MPPPGGWPPPQQPGPPPNRSQPHGQLGYNPQQTPGWQQGGWPQQPGPPSRKGNSLKWLLIAVAVLLVIGITVGVTLIYTHDSGSGGTTTSTSGAPSDLASANDTGPVTIITDEPTCTTFYSLNDGLAQVEPKGWGEARATFGPASDWSPDQRSQVETVAKSMRKAADQAVALAKQTPHRVVRELYQQFIAYGRAYADSIPNYTPRDNELASANVNASSVLLGICNAIEGGSTSRALAIEPVDPPSQVATPGEPTDPKRFIEATDSSCTEWIQRLDAFNAATVDWQNRDGSVPGAQWTPGQKALVDATLPVLTKYANDIAAAGRDSENAVFEDFAETAALYIRAFVAAGDDYEVADGWLNFTGFRLANLVSSACRAVAG
jgi:hypothetical protein